MSGLGHRRLIVERDRQRCADQQARGARIGALVDAVKGVTGTDQDRHLDRRGDRAGDGEAEQDLGDSGAGTAPACRVSGQDRRGAPRSGHRT